MNLSSIKKSIIPECTAKSYFQDPSGLPRMLIEKIFLILAENGLLKDIGSLRITCKRLLAVSKQELIWKVFCLKIDGLSDYTEDYLNIYQRYQMCKKNIMEGVYTLSSKNLKVTTTHTNNIIEVESSDKRGHICNTLQRKCFNTDLKIFKNPTIQEHGFGKFIAFTPKLDQAICNIGVLDLTSKKFKSIDVKAEACVSGSYVFGKTTLNIPSLLYLDPTFLAILHHNQWSDSFDLQVWDMAKGIQEKTRTIDQVVKNVSKSVKNVEVFTDKELVFFIHQKSTGNRNHIRVYDTKYKFKHKYHVEKSVFTKFSKYDIIPFVCDKYMAYWSSNDGLITVVDRQRGSKCYIDLGSLEEDMKAMKALQEGQDSFCCINEKQKLFFCSYQDEKDGGKKIMQVWDLEENRPLTKCAIQDPNQAVYYVVSDVVHLGTPFGEALFLDMRSLLELKEIGRVKNQATSDPTGHCLFLNLSPGEENAPPFAKMYNTELKKQIDLEFEIGVEDYEYDFTSSASWENFLAITAQGNDSGYVFIFSLKDGKRLMKIPIKDDLLYSSLTWLNGCLIVSRGVDEENQKDYIINFDIEHDFPCSEEKK